MRILTNEQMQEVDEETIARVCPGIELMERAGRGCAQVIHERYGDEDGDTKAAVFVGKGNNGGDGLVVGRYLAEAGWRVSIHLLGPLEKLTPDAVRNYQSIDNIIDTNTRVVDFDADDPDWLVRAAADLNDTDVVVDAIFGTGISGAPRGVALDAIRLINDCEAPVVSIDIPSGINGSTGEAPGDAIIATDTLTIGAPKVGTLFHPGRENCAEVTVIDIGFPDDIIEKHAGDVTLLDIQEAALRLPYRAPDVNKFDVGTAVIVAGSRQYRGAALLAAEAALRGGCGMVYLAVPESIRTEVDVALREAITVGLPETADGTVAPGALEHIAPFLERAHCAAIGPGLGRNADTNQFVEAFLRQCEIPVVVDADAITAFAGRFDKLAEIAKTVALVITPHSGELARLLGTDLPDDAPGRIESTARIARDLGAVVIHKGPTSLVAHPTEGVFVCAVGNSTLATGGTGDVLTGFVASFIAQGAQPLDGALVATFLHGRAGEAAGEERGKRGAIASDLFHTLAETMIALEAMAGD